MCNNLISVRIFLIHILVICIPTFFCFGCKTKQTYHFTKIDPTQSGIDFNNTIIENDTINPLDLEFLYNGGGIAVADFNLDGLPDLYFTASTVANKLYLNKGNLHFEDITKVSETNGEGRWCNGASVADVNQDGLPDIYVSASIKKDANARKNLLYINQGLNKDSIPYFKEMAEEYGLADTSYSVQSAFFDYDNDGDLDMYLLTTKLTERDVNQFTPTFNRDVFDSTEFGVDRLYINNWNDSLKHPFFTNISFESGIRYKGYGLGLVIGDLNKDGWKDIYAANDFYGNDLLYMNQKNGTFKEQLKSSFKHTSMNSMGADIADINNDGWPDLLTVDMNPADNYRKKKNMGGNNYFMYQNFKQGNYMFQTVRNTLQLHMGLKPGTNDPIFADISYMAGVAETDWSWNPTIADFDNDGLRDIIITNGYPRDVTDHDFGMFKASNSVLVSKKELIAQIPKVKISNYAFKNKNGLQFKDVTSEWGLQLPTFSNGAIAADLDNDGDLDYVINNINEPALLYKNNTIETSKKNQHYLKLRLQGPSKNKQGYGTIVKIYAGNLMMMEDYNPCRGYLSSMATDLFFGLGQYAKTDSIIITWPGGNIQKIYNQPADTLLTIKYEKLTSNSNIHNLIETIFNSLPQKQRILFKHIENDHIDFNYQRLLPHKLSQYGPPIAVSDINNDGSDDVVIGGNGDFESSIYLQQKDGSFIAKKILHDKGSNARRPEITSLLVFDMNGDKLPDIYAGCGSNEWPENSPTYQDRIYINKGNGNFQLIQEALPKSFNSTGCVRATDYDNDGDVDLFVGSRQIPNKYPMPATSFILQNNSKGNRIIFKNVTAIVAPFLSKAGVISDALWTDFNNDRQPDLVIAGEWMPITFLQQKNGIFENITTTSGTHKLKGWWNSITACDIDNDGDIDYIAGNLGLNSFYKATSDMPVNIYVGDFDKNGNLDVIPSLFLPGKNGKKEEFPAHTRDDVTEQNPTLKKKYLSYKSFASASMKEITKSFPEETITIYSATNFNSGIFINKGKNSFEFLPFSSEAQTSPMFGITALDLDNDGLDDIVATGNDFGGEVNLGQYDASNGWVLHNNGKNDFTSLPISRSGFYVPGNGKAIAWLQMSNKNMCLIASQNQDSLLQFNLNPKTQWVNYQPQLHEALIFHMKNGSTKKAECYYSMGFAAQSSNRIQIPFGTYSITILFRNKQSKKITIQDVSNKQMVLPLF